MTFKGNELTQPCRYGCGTTIIWKGKVGQKKGSTGWFEYDNQELEHTYSRCYDIRIEKGLYHVKENNNKNKK